MNKIEYFVENNPDGTKKSHWGYMFSKDTIIIQDYISHHEISINLSANNSWTYTTPKTIETKNSFCRGIEISSQDYTMSIYVHDPKILDDVITTANLDLVCNNATTRLRIPYKLAIALMKIMASS